MTEIVVEDLPRNCWVCGALIQQLAFSDERFGLDGMAKHYSVIHPGRTVGDAQQRGDWSVRNA